MIDGLWKKRIKARRLKQKELCVWPLLSLPSGNRQGQVIESFLLLLIHRYIQRNTKTIFFGEINVVSRKQHHVMLSSRNIHEM